MNRNLSLLFLFIFLLSAVSVKAQNEQFYYMIEPNTKYTVYVTGPSIGNAAYMVITFTSSGNETQDMEYIRTRLTRDFHNIAQIPYDPSILQGRTVSQTMQVSTTPDMIGDIQRTFNFTMPWWGSMLITLAFIGLLFS